MKRLFIIPGSAFLLLLGGLVVVPGLIDWSAYREEIEHQAEKATGLDFALDGEISLAFLPSPRLAVGGLRISQNSAFWPGAETESERRMRPLANLERAEILLSFPDLFAGKLRIRTIRFLSPQIFVAQNASGRWNWQTDEIDRLMNGEELPPIESAEPSSREQASTKSQLNKAGASSFDIAIDRFEISGGEIHYLSLENGEETSITDANLRLRADSFSSGPFSVQGGFIYDKEKISFSVSTGRLDPQTKDLKIQTEIALGARNLTLSYNGLLRTAPALDLQGPFVLRAGLPDDFPGLKGHVDMRGVLTYAQDEDVLALRDLDFSLGGHKGHGAVTLKGLAVRNPLHFEAALDCPDVLKVSLPDFSVFPGAPGQHQGEKTKTSPGEGAEASSSQTVFLPDPLVLPFPVEGAASLTFGGLAVVSEDEVLDSGPLIFRFSAKDKSFSAGIQARSFLSGGSFDLSADIVYAADSRNTGNGTLVLSEPELSWKVEAPRLPLARLVSLSSAFSKDDAPLVPEDIARLFSMSGFQTAAFSLSGLHDGQDFILSEGSYLIWPKSPLRLSGRISGLMNSGARPAISARLYSEYFDADSLLKALEPEYTAPSSRTDAGTSSVALPAQTAGQIGESVRRSFDLPVDLDLSLKIDELLYDTQHFRDLALRASLKGKSFTLSSLQASGFYDASFSAQGIVSDITTLSGVDLNFAARSKNTGALAAAAGLDFSALPASLGAAEGALSVRGDSERMGFVLNAKAFNGQAAVEGAISALLSDSPAVSEIVARITHPDLSEAIRVISPGLSPGKALSKPVDIYTKARKDGDLYRFDPVTGQIGPTQADGLLNVDFSGPVPAVSGEVALGKLPLSAFLGKAESKSASASLSGSAPGPSTPSSQAGTAGGSHWSRNAIDTAPFHAIALDLALKAEQITHDGWSLDYPALNLDLSNGHLKIQDLTAGLFGGTLTGNADLIASGNPEQLEVSCQAALDSVGLESFVKAFSGTSLVRSDGDITGDFSLNSRGVSPAALMFALAGEGQAEGSDLTLKGFDLGRLSNTLDAASGFEEKASALFKSSMSGGATRFDRFEMETTIEEGIASFSKLNLTGNVADISTTGKLHLPQWALDLESTVALKVPDDAPSFSLRFTGPINNPGRTFGASALENYLKKELSRKIQDIVEKEDINSAIGDVLNRALGAAGENGKSSDTATKTEENPPSRKIEDDVKSLLKGLLQ